MTMSRRWIVLIAWIALAAQLAPASGQAQNRAGLVIQYPDGRAATYCVRFGEPSITGLELLNRSGLRPVAEVGGLGSAVCSIDGQGCAYPAQPCFCQCQGATCAYWNYLHLIDGAWRYSPVGASNYVVADGAIDGWAWGDQAAPPVYTINQICSESANQRAGGSTSQPTSHPTSEPTREPTSQRVSESTAIPTPSPVVGPTVAPTIAPTMPPAALPALQPAIQATSRPANSTAAQTDLGGYVMFAVVVLVLGGWLILSQSRRQR